MRNDERFEIQRAFDLLPHVVGASWTAVWFRMQGIRKPLREEFREKTLEYLKMIEPFLTHTQKMKILKKFANT